MHQMGLLLREYPVLEFLVAIQTLIEFPKSGLIAIPL